MLLSTSLSFSVSGSLWSRVGTRMSESLSNVWRLPGPGILACDIAVGRPLLLNSSDILLLLEKEQKTKQAKRFKHHETRGSRTFVDDKHLCRTGCLHWASLHRPLTPIERHDGSEFTSIVQEEQVIGLLPLVVAFFTKYPVHFAGQSAKYSRSQEKQAFAMERIM